MKDVHRLTLLGVVLISIPENGVTAQSGAESSFMVEVKEKQDSDPILLELKGAVNNQREEVFSQWGDGVLRYQGRLCVSDVGELRQHILAEAHNFSIYFIQVPLRYTASAGSLLVEWHEEKYSKHCE